MCAGRGRPTRSDEEDERGPAQPVPSSDAPSDPSVGGLLTRLRDPRRLLAIALLAITGGLVFAFIYARGELAGSDALAYWKSVQLWLSGADPYATPAGVLPYAYAPWSLFVFLPWALIPWDIAWFVWRAANIALFGASVAWAYKRRPLGTAAFVALLGPSIAANFDTGNINVFIALGTWVAFWAGPRLGGFLWALGTGLKFVPAFLLLFIPRRAWIPGLGVLAVLAILTVATWPDTLKQLDVVLNYPRPVRLDYMLLGWGAVPWLWSRPWPPRLSRAIDPGER